MATVAGVYIDPFAIKEMTVIVAVFAHERDDFRIHFHPFHLLPSRHKRVEYILPSAGTDNECAFARAKIIGEKGRLAAQKKQAAEIASKTKHIRPRTAVHV